MRAPITHVLGARPNFIKAGPRIARVITGWLAAR